MSLFHKPTENQALGNLGEDAAADYLKKKGYRILHRNLKEGREEIDIVAENRGTVIFAEVKTREITATQYLTAAEAVSEEKRSHLVRAARRYIASERGRSPYDIPLYRFDVIEVYTENRKVVRIEHYENAFFAERRHKKGNSPWKKI